MTFVKRPKNANPAGGVNPAQAPNVGQYGWTSFDAANVNQLIDYVRLAREAAESAKTDSEYIKMQLANIDSTLLYFEKLYSEIKPIAENIHLIYAEVVKIRDRVDIQHADVVRMDEQIRAMFLEVQDILVEMKALRDETGVYKDSAKNSETISVDAMNKSLEIYEELRKGQVYRGSWNPNTAKYPDPKDTNSVWDVVLNAGQEDTGFVFDNKRWYFGDRLIFVKDESKFEHLASGTSVKSVNGLTGAVVLDAAKVGALDIKGGSLTGMLSVNTGGIHAKGGGALRATDANDINVRAVSTGSYGYFQSGHTSNDTNQRMALTGYSGKDLTELLMKMKTGVNPTIRWGGDTYSLYHAGNKPTPGDINAVSRQGDTMNGLLTNTAGIVSHGSVKYHHQSVGRGLTLSVNETGYSELVPWVNGVEMWSNGLRHYSGNDWRVSNQKIYHQGNKPTAAEVGALSSSGGDVSGNLYVNGAVAISIRSGNKMMTKYIGETVSDKAALLLFCPNTTATGVAPQGFHGTVHVMRGAVNAYNLVQEVTLTARVAYTEMAAHIHDQYVSRSATPLRLVTTTYNGAEWIGLHMPATAARTVSIHGVVSGNDPILITDSKDMILVDFITRSDIIRSSGEASTINVVGGASHEGYRYNNKVVVGGQSDTWLRLNPNNHFSSGIYSPSGIFRHDGGTLELKNWATGTAKPVRLSIPSSEQYVTPEPGVATLNVKAPGSNNATRLINFYDDAGKVRSSIVGRDDTSGAISVITHGANDNGNRVTISGGQVFTYGNQSANNDALTKVSYTEGRYLKKTNDTMSGTLKANSVEASLIHDKGYFVMRPYGSTYDDGAFIRGYYRAHDSGTPGTGWRGIQWDAYTPANASTGAAAKSESFHMKVGPNFVYHQGYKPTSTDVGAMSSTPIRVTTSVDLNSYTTNGTYNLYKGAGVTLTNAPDGFDYGTLLVVGSGTTAQTFVTQTLNARGATGKTWIRTRNDGAAAWYPWAEVFTTTNPPKIDQIDAVLKTGDTMSGHLYMDNNADIYFKGEGTNNPIIWFQDKDNANKSKVAVYHDRTGDTFAVNHYDSNSGSYAGFRMKYGNKAPTYAPGTGGTFFMYHEGFKPSAADVGAPVLNSSQKAIEIQSPDSTVTAKGMIRARKDGAEQVSWMTDRPTDGTHKALGIHSGRGPVYWDEGSVREIFHTGKPPTFDDLLAGNTEVSMFKTTTLQRPAGAVDGKYYPIVITNTLNHPGIYISTASGAGGIPMNNCSFSGQVRSAGWSDKTTCLEGMFSIYDSKERAIHSIVGGTEQENVYAIYVEARAFPLDIRISSKGNIYCDGKDINNGSSTFKAAITPSDTDGAVFGTKVRILKSFNNGTGTYSSNITTGIITTAGGITAGARVLVENADAPGVIMAKRPGNNNFAMMGQSSAASGDFLAGTGPNTAAYTSFIRVSPSSLSYSKDGSNDSRIYHEGFKPNAGDVGALATTGGTLSGKLTINAASSHIDLVETDMSNKVWRLEGSGGNFNLTEANVGTRATFKAGGGSEFSGAMKVNGTLETTGLITMSGTPTAAQHVATKVYADTKVGLSGGTMTGNLVVPRIIMASTANGITSHTNANLIRSGSTGNDVVIGSASGSTYVDVINTQGLLARVGNTTYKIYHEGFKPTASVLGVYTKAEVDTKFSGKTIGNSQSIGANENLDNYKTAGVYHQPANANASNGTNYPEKLAGSLIVYTAAGIVQEYRVYDSSRVWVRAQYSNSAWKPWARQYNTENKPTPADVGALALTGGTVTGETTLAAVNTTSRVKYYDGTTKRGLTLSSNAAGYAELVGNINGTEDWTGGLRHYATGDWRISNNKIYHEGFKPTAANVGALASTGGNMTGHLNMTSGAILKFITSTYSAGAQIYARDGGQYGADLIITSGGNTVIGSGESGVAQSNELASGSENMFVTSDGEINLISGANTWADRKTTKIANTGDITVNNGKTVARVHLGDSKSYLARSSDNVYLAANGTNGRVYLEGKNHPYARVNGVDYGIYHAGLKPTAADVGAMPIGGGTFTNQVNLSIRKSAMRVLNQASITYYDQSHVWFQNYAEGSELVWATGNDSSQTRRMALTSDGTLGLTGGVNAAGNFTANNGGSFLASGIFRTTRDVNPMVEWHRPGIQAYIQYIHGDNSLRVSTSNGSGSEASFCTATTPNLFQASGKIQTNANAGRAWEEVSKSGFYVDNSTINAGNGTLQAAVSMYTYHPGQYYGEIYYGVFHGATWSSGAQVLTSFDNSAKARMTWSFKNNGGLEQSNGSWRIDNGGGVVGSIYGGGYFHDWIHRNFAPISDGNLKTVLGKSKTSALDKVSQMKFHEFIWKEDEATKQLTKRDVKLNRIGVIAQELEAIDPSYTRDIEIYTPEGELEKSTKTLDTANLLAVALKAIQELSIEVADLKAQLASK